MKDDIIFLDSIPPFVPREGAESDPAYIKHVQCEGARFHVISYDTQGRHCSEPMCIINKEGARP
jgi:hypothetical protein